MNPVRRLKKQFESSSPARSSSASCAASKNSTSFRSPEKSSAVVSSKVSRLCNGLSMMSAKSSTDGCDFNALTSSRYNSQKMSSGTSSWSVSGSQISRQVSDQTPMNSPRMATVPPERRGVGAPRRGDPVRRARRAAEVSSARRRRPYLRTLFEVPPVGPAD